MSGNSNLLCAHCMQAHEYLMSAGRHQSLSFPWTWPNPLKTTSGFRDGPCEVHTGNPSRLVRALVPQLIFPLVFCLPLRLCQDVHLECPPLPTYPSLTLPSRSAQPSPPPPTPEGQHFPAVPHSRISVLCPSYSRCICIRLVLPEIAKIGVWPAKWRDKSKNLQGDIQ